MPMEGCLNEVEVHFKRLYPIFHLPSCRVRYRKPLVVWFQYGYYRLVALLHVQHHPLLSSIQHVNPVEALKDPAGRRRLSWILFLI